MSNLMKAQEVADFLGVDKSWVYRRASEGKLPCYRVDGIVRFSRTAVDHWLERMEAERA